MQSTRLIETLIDLGLANPEATTTLIVTVIGAAESYRRTGSIPIGRIPWRQARQLFRELGDKYFGVSRPRGVPGLLVEAPPIVVERALRGRHYESVDLYSYEYEGEIANLRRPAGVRPHPTTGEDVPMETHPRTFETSREHTFVLCHDEASRFEATGLHLSETMMSWERGRDTVSADLENAGLSVEPVESEATADIEVIG